MQTKQTSKQHNSIIVESLKKTYFEKLKQENSPNTPEITKELNELEDAIKELLKG
jgi:hypothetical protein